MPGTPIDLEWVPEPSPEVAMRLKRLRWLAWIMDRSIPLGGGRRIGLDPLIGLIPGLGDWLGAAISSWLVYEAIRLGLPLRVLARMVLNIAIEAAVGAVPLLGDLFDAVWQANQRNLRLVEGHYDARLKPRPLRWIPVAFVILAGLFLVAVAALIVLVVRTIWTVFGGGA
jgi:hypothetical protein